MSKFRFDIKARKFTQMKDQLLTKLGNEAVNYFKLDVFESKAFNGSPWAPNKSNDGRQQLVKTGRMRQSIRIIKKTSNSVVVGSDVPYAVYHNEGTKTLPKRQFIGSAAGLERKIKTDINNFLRRFKSVR